MLLPVLHVLLLSTTALAFDAYPTRDFLGTLGDRAVPGFNCWNAAPGAPGCGGLPPNQTAAVAAGWVTAHGVQCNAIYGVRFRHPSRPNPTLMFDRRGRLAGLQFEVDHTPGWGGSASGYPVWPGSNVKPPYWASEDGSHARHITAHFSDPGLMCLDSGAAAPPGAVGDRLWVRTSTQDNLRHSFEPVPLKRRGLYAGATSRLGWATGGCLTSQDLLNFKKAGAPSFKDMEPPFQAMGQHYWRTGGVQGNTANAPFSLLYDDNDDLVAFIFIVNAISPIWPTRSGAMEPAANPWYEFPAQPLPPFFHQVGQMPPELLWLNSGKLAEPCGGYSTATMHVQFRDTSNITTAACAMDQFAADATDPFCYVPPPGVAAPPAVANILRECYSQSGRDGWKRTCARELELACEAGQITDDASAALCGEPKKKEGEGGAKTCDTSPGWVAGLALMGFACVVLLGVVFRRMTHYQHSAAKGTDPATAAVELALPGGGCGARMAGGEEGSGRGEEDERRLVSPPQDIDNPLNGGSVNVAVRPTRLADGPVARAAAATAATAADGGQRGD